MSFFLPMCDKCVNRAPGNFEIGFLFRVLGTRSVINLIMIRILHFHFVASHTSISLFLFVCFPYSEGHLCLSNVTLVLGLRSVKHMPDTELILFLFYWWCLEVVSFSDIPKVLPRGVEKNRTFRQLRLWNLRKMWCHYFSVNCG